MFFLRTQHIYTHQETMTTLGQYAHSQLESLCSIKLQSVVVITNTHKRGVVNRGVVGSY